MLAGPSTHPSKSVAVCPNCCHTNPPAYHFCLHCNTPLSSMAAILPPWYPWAIGSVVRRAVRQTDRWFVLIGMWLLFAPQIFVLCFPLISQDLSREWHAGERLAVIVGTVFLLIFQGGLLLLHVTILYLTTRNFFRNRAQLWAENSQK